MSRKYIHFYSDWIRVSIYFGGFYTFSTFYLYFPKTNYVMNSEQRRQMVGKIQKNSSRQQLCSLHQFLVVKFDAAATTFNRSNTTTVSFTLLTMIWT